MHVFVTCKHKKDRIKSQWGFLFWSEFWSNLPQNIMQPFPTPVMLHIKFDQDWLAGLRDIEVRKCKIFVIQGQVTPKWVHGEYSGPNPGDYLVWFLFYTPSTYFMSFLITVPGQAS